MPSPFTATIHLDVWLHERDRAAAVLEQLVAKLEHEATDDRGGVAVHHRIAGVTLEPRSTE